MIIYIISTFITPAAANVFLEEHGGLLGDSRFHFVFSVSSDEGLDQHADYWAAVENLDFVVKRDSSYAEGWNNALSAFRMLNVADCDRCVFLGRCFQEVWVASSQNDEVLIPIHTVDRRI